MNAKSLILLLALPMVLPSWLPAATNDLTTALQKGLFEEEANHDLNAAIRAYQAIATQFDRDRKLAATAIFRLGECYRKQGNTNDAKVQYDRVLREFADQPALATLSRQNLALMGASPTLATGSAASSAARQEQKRLLQEEINLAEQTLAEQQKMLQNGVVSQETLRTTQRDILRLKRQLAALDVGSTTAVDLEPASSVVTSTEAEEVKRIQGMIKDSPDLINAVDEHSGRTPLQDAAAKGQLMVAQFLLDNGADAAAKDRSGWTPLHLAAAGGHRAMAELLMSKKASLVVFDNRGGTPLHAAAEKGYRSIVELFLANGAGVNAAKVDGPTPLHLAAANGFRAVAEVLLAQGADPNIVVKQFVSTGNDAYQGAPLHIAALRGDAALAELLLAHKGQVGAFNSKGQTPLHVAAEMGQVAIAKLLLSHGAEVNAKARGDTQRDWTPLAFAVIGDRKEMAALLLEHGADANLQFDTPSEKRCTALLLAVGERSPDFTDLLLSHHADPNLRNGAGNVPLFKATISSHADHEHLVKTLLEHGAEPDARTSEGQTMLMEAAQRFDKPAVELLLAHKANVNAQNKRGWSPLHFLAVQVTNGRGDATDLAKLLLSAGADVNLQNEEGKTPFAYLPLASPRLEYQAKMVELLRQHGAREDLPRLDRIEVRRPSANYSATIFSKGTNAWNHFSLLELVAVHYGLVSAGIASGGMLPTPQRAVTGLPFPNLQAIVARHPKPDRKGWTETKVNLEAIFKSGDCSRDLALEWGDIVEIPEMDHPINAIWPGLPEEGAAMLADCLKRHVQLTIKGLTTNLVLSIAWHPWNPTGGVPVTSPIGPPTQFTVLSLLRDSGLLRASSDLSRVKVARTDPAAGQTHEWVLDCSPPALRLTFGYVTAI